MPEIETILLILVVIAALMGGIFSRVSPGLVAVMVAFGYFVVAFFVFYKSETLWFVTLLMGFALAAVAAMAASFSGRALSKLLPKRD